MVQLDDLAYISVANEHVPSNLIVGDSIEVRVKNDNLWIKAPPHHDWTYNPTEEIKTKIIVRKRMIEDTKPPSCSLSITLH